LTDLHHPCQALADLLTIRERFGRLDHLKLAFLGAGNNVSHSLIQAGALTGMHVVVATPRGLGPDPSVMQGALATSTASGAVLELTDDPLRAVEGADVVYTDVWVSMGDSPEAREARLRALEPFRVDEALMARTGDRSIFMHCLPAHRGEEVVDEVIDGPRSVVLDQAENRMHTEQGLLVALLSGTLTGGPR
jgi:ornithine carbamoyltransferase